MLYGNRREIYDLSLDELLVISFDIFHLPIDRATRYRVVVLTPSH